MQIVKSAEYFLFANYSTQRSYRNQDATLKRKSPEHSFYRQIYQKNTATQKQKKKEKKCKMQIVKSAESFLFAN